MARRAAQDAAAEARPGSRNLKVLLTLGRFLRPYRWRVAGALVAMMCASGAVLAIGGGLRRLIDRGFADGSILSLDRAVLSLLVVVAVLAAGTFGRFYLVSWIGERVVADIRASLYRHLLSLSPGWFESIRSGEVLTRLTNDTTLLQTVIGSSASVALRNLLLLAGGLVLLVVTSPRLTGFVLLMVPLVVLPILLFGRRVRALSRESQDRVADLGAQAGETLGAVRTVQAFTYEDHERRAFTAACERAFATARRRILARAWLTAIVMLLVFGAVAFLLWLGGNDVLSGRMSAGELAAFIFYAVVVASAVGGLGEVAGDLQRAAGAAERIQELLTTPVTIAAPAKPRALPSPGRGAIAFDRVTFAYPSRPDLLSLHDFDLTIAPGESVALVGPSGAGKTTVLQLLLRFYDPQEGVVRLDGEDIAAVDPGALRRRMGLVPQDPVIFSGTVEENIRLGRPEADEAAVRAAAEAAHAWSFVAALPEGLRTPLGERGVRLSGGQRQRVAIARAILRDPQVLLLDEATSALDSESERVVQEALERLMRGRTTLVIAHRLATVLKADRIVVMDGGRVAAVGSHESLMADREGLYARLARLQFVDYGGSSPDR